MTDRVPLIEAVDKPEIKQETASSDPSRTPDQEQAISEMRMLKDMSIMFGFDGMGFDGMGREAETILGWMKESPDPVLSLKFLLDRLGENGNRRQLLRKAYEWVRLDTSQRDTRKRQRALEKSLMGI